jgi:Protein of unknown function (DUF3422)
VRDIQALNKLSEEISSLGSNLDDLNINKIEGGEDAEKFEESFNKFNRLTKNADEPIKRDGISFRIERSRFYVKAFERLIPDLRNKDLQGFQSYPNFVRRRYGASWDRIDRIGIRHERLAKRLDYLSNHRQALGLAASGSVQAKLLRTAERVSVIPIAYYAKDPMTSLLAASGLDVLKPATFFINVAIFALLMLIWPRSKEETGKGPSHTDRSLWVVVLLLGMAFSGWLAWQKDKPKTPPVERSAPKALTPPSAEKPS